MENEKKQYSKPMLEKVRLIADEAVLAGCKSGGAFGLNGVDQCNPSSPTVWQLTGAS